MFGQENLKQLQAQHPERKTKGHYDSAAYLEAGPGKVPWGRVKHRRHPVRVLLAWFTSRRCRSSPAVCGKDPSSRLRSQLRAVRSAIWAVHRRSQGMMSAEDVSEIGQAKAKVKTVEAVEQ